MFTRAAGPACPNGWVRVDPHTGHGARVGRPGLGTASGGGAPAGSSVGWSLTRGGDGSRRPRRGCPGEDQAPWRPADLVTNVGRAWSQHAVSLLYRDSTVVQPGSSHIRTDADFDAALARSWIGGPNAVRPVVPPMRDMPASSPSSASRSETDGVAAQIAT
jgi:hypothetical protein